ncbi:hypothetical protein SAMN04487995_3670 [Dyadobacter koreensis]|uniref:Uncharacterized protein n=1 Tax=Dyadobacter koreensis TaxID=408657 RepID=A0A1H6WNQ5_9BACT|nr:hypothetical protein SAMN04487995_3670 [Dyadobacter koreensis]
MERSKIWLTPILTFTHSKLNREGVIGNGTSQKTCLIHLIRIAFGRKAGSTNDKKTEELLLGSSQ